MEIGRYRLRVTDAAGRTVARRRGKMHSYTRNILQLMRYSLGDNSNALLNLSGGAISTNTQSFAASTSAGVSGRGVVVGTSAASSAFTDNDLGARIAHGSGSGQLSYGTQSQTTSSGSGIYSAVVVRTFTNLTASTITVNEVGLIATSSTSGSATSNAHLILRDVLGSGVAVPAGGQLHVELTFAYNGGSSIVNSSGAGVLRYLVTQASVAPPNIIGGTATAQAGFTWAGTAVAVGTTQGIRVGTGTAAFDPDASSQRTLDAAIEHGSGSGQLLWTECLLDATVADGAGGYIRGRRTFVNDSGASITINEVAVYGYGMNVTRNDTNTAMLARKVLDVPITLLDGEAVEITVDLACTH